MDAAHDAAGADHWNHAAGPESYKQAVIDMLMLCARFYHWGFEVNIHGPAGIVNNLLCRLTASIKCLRNFKELSSQSKDGGAKMKPAPVAGGLESCCDSALVCAALPVEDRVVRAIINERAEVRLNPTFLRVRILTACVRIKYSLSTVNDFTYGPEIVPSDQFNGIFL